MVAAEAEATAREAEANATVRTYTCSTGIVLNIRAVPPRVRTDAMANVPRPKVPKVWIESLGREEENPDDPQYAADLIAWRDEEMRRSFQITFALGTSVNTVPEGYFRPEQDEWIDEIEAVAELNGVESSVRRAPEKARYIDWLMYYALGNEEDHAILTTILYSVSLVTEGALAQAIASFRRLTEQRADPESGTPAGDP